MTTLRNLWNSAVTTIKRTTKKVYNFVADPYAIVGFVAGILLI